MRRPSAVEEALHPERVAVAERAGVADVPADRLRAALADQALQPAAMSSIASSQRHRLELARAADALERVQHAVGVVLDSVIAIPFGQAYPRESGCSRSGRSFVSRPSSTVATIPHSGSQMRQKVTLSSTAIGRV